MIRANIIRAPLNRIAETGDRNTPYSKDNVDEVYFISGSSRNPMKKTASGDYLITTPIGPHL